MTDTATDPDACPLADPVAGVTLSHVPVPNVEAEALNVTGVVLLVLIWTCCGVGADPPAGVVKKRPTGARSGLGAAVLDSRFKTAVTYWGEFNELESVILTIA